MAFLCVFTQGGGGKDGQRKGNTDTETEEKFSGVSLHEDTDPIG